MCLYSISAISKSIEITELIRRVISWKKICLCQDSLEEINYLINLGGHIYIILEKAVMETGFR